MYTSLSSIIDFQEKALGDAPKTVRRLSDLRGCFVDQTFYEAALAQDDPTIYTVSSVEPAQGEGQLHYGLGILQPGKIGLEYYLTRGHLHAWRAAAEVYIGLKGEGMLLLEDEATGESQLLPLLPHSVVYVPGHMAHRTINIGAEPLAYLGVYPADAGHDYGAIATRNFRKVVISLKGKPTLINRDEWKNVISNLQVPLPTS